MAILKKKQVIKWESRQVIYIYIWPFAARHFIERYKMAVEINKNRQRKPYILTVLVTQQDPSF